MRLCSGVGTIFSGYGSYIFFYMRMCLIGGESYEFQRIPRELTTPKMVWEFLASEATRRTSLSHGHWVLKISKVSYRICRV